MNSRKLAVLSALTLTLVLGLMFFGAHKTRAAGPWFVHPAGNDANDCLSLATPCRTINGAIGKALAGDTINVAAGTYTEQLDITKGLTIVGDVSNPDNVVIDGLNNTSLPSVGQVRIYNPTGPVVFEGFKIVNGGANGGEYYAILTKGNQPVTIQHSKIIGHGSSLTVGDDYGLWAYTGTGALVISDNYFNAMYHAILLEQRYGAVTVENNTFDALMTGVYPVDGLKYGGRAIEAIVYGSTDVDSLQEVKGNHFVNFKSTGVQFSGGFLGQTPRKFTNVVIEDNDFNFATTDIVNLNGAVFLKNVSLPSNSDPAGGVSANIHNNVVSVPSGNGIWVKGLNGTITINNNSIAGNLYGLQATDSLGSIIDATCNWWGAANGPGPVGPSSGDKVSLNVNFTPWLVVSGGPCTGPDTAAPTVSSVTVTPSVGKSGTPITLSSTAADASGLQEVYYNLFSAGPGSPFVCTLAHVVGPFGNGPYTDTVSGLTMPFAGVSPPGGIPCPSGGITDGTYVVTANWIDILGNAVGGPYPGNTNITSYPPTAISNPFVYDNTPPTVTPPAAVTLYTGPGATSCDVTVSNLDGTLGTATATDNLTGVVSIVRSGVPAGNVFPVGTTIVTYTATDGAGNTASANQTVIVKDNTPPTLTLLGANPMTILYAQTFVDPGATALDNCGGNLTGSIVRTGSVNSFVVGTYTLTYTVTDLSGNSTTKTRIVNVVANPPTNKDQCKNDGWKTRTNGAGKPFKNQGQCIDYVNDKKAKDDKDKKDKDDKDEKGDKHDH